MAFLLSGINPRNSSTVFPLLRQFFNSYLAASPAVSGLRMGGVSYTIYLQQLSITEEIK